MKLFEFANDDKSDTGFEMKSVAICSLSEEEAKVFADFASACAEELIALGADCDPLHFAGGKVPDITIERLIPDLMPDKEP